MKKSFLVIGLGRFGLGVAQILSEQNVDLVAIDINEDAVSVASDFVEHCMICDSTNEHNLLQLGVKNIDHAVVAIGNNIQATILTTVLLKNIGVKKLTVRVDDEFFVPVMKKLGADEVISPEKIAAKHIGSRIVSDSFADYYSIADEYAIVQVIVNSKFNEMLLHNLDPRNKFDVNVILIQRNGTSFIPKGTDYIKPGDTIMVIAKIVKINKFDAFINGQ